MTEFAALRLHLVTDGVEEGAAGVRDVGHAAEEASGGVHVLDEAMDKLVERFALWRAFDQVLDWMKEFARDGFEAARAMQLLNNQLELTAPGMTYLQDSAKDAIEQVSGLGESTDKDLTTALQRLILITGDAAWSIQHLQTAQDIAAATGMDLVTSATDLGRAYNGVWIQLERLGLVTKEQVESGGAMDALIQKTQDMTAAANEGAGAWHKLGIEIANAAERAAAGLEKGFGPLASFLSRFLLEKIPEGPGIDPLKFLFPGLLGPNPGTGPSPGGAFPGLSGSTAGGADTMGSPAWWAAQQSAAFQIGTTFTPEQIKATAELQAKAAAAAARAAAKDAAEHPYLGPGYGTPSDLGLIGGGMPYQGTEQGFGALESPALGQTLTGMGANLSATGAGMATTINLDKLVADTQKNSDKLKALNQQLTGDISEMWQRMAQDIIRSFESALSGHKLSTVFGDLGKDVLKGIGQMMVEQGQALITYSAIMIPLETALASLFGAGPAAAAAGVALVALGSAFGAIASSGAAPGSGSAGGSSAGSFSPHGVSSTSYLLPTPGSPFAAGEKYPGLVQPTFNVIGTGDPRAMSDITTLLNKAVGRGYSVPGIAGS